LLSLYFSFLIFILFLILIVSSPCDVFVTGHQLGAVKAFLGASTKVHVWLSIKKGTQIISFLNLNPVIPQ